MQLHNIDTSSLITGAILGSAVLYGVKLYQSKKEFVADQSKHFAVVRYSEHKYGFLLPYAKRFDKPIPLKARRLGFFDASMHESNDNDAVLESRLAHTSIEYSTLRIE